ncbi:ATP-dependent DNA helicase [Paracandidimonas lactea]|uniref:ATP-dependent DNA helicase n=1 Tax=Paracandidimonas lactea TaxID=2895524 RepID=UPI001F3FB776|nr:ATP-dependent DNA helicase [Paracandidimonas lactea]
MSYTVSVRALCEFTARAGDLDLRFTPSPTALEGIEGHAIVRARRPAGYEQEVFLSETLELGSAGHTLIVRGRADGYAPLLNRLEEIKTHRGDADAIPANHRALHWAQARIYGHLMCRTRGFASINLALVYYELDEGTETLLTESWAADALAEYTQGLYQAFARWALQESQHRVLRDETLDGLKFPFSHMRPGQRQLAEAVYKTTVQSRRLLAQAPTGVGKTLGTLFPMLKAAPRTSLDAVYFLTAKTSGRQLALDSLAQLLGTRDANETRPPGVRVLELAAREKTCEHPGKACHGDDCPLARGFYDRLPAARDEAVVHGWLDRPALRRIALAHGICPYWLSHDLAQWADVVVGDYNYYFDTSALLRGLALQRQWRVGLLVDEAHNLVDRACAMYSASLRLPTLRAARAGATPALRRTLDAVLRAWRDAFGGQEQGWQAYDTLPAKLLTTLQAASATLGEHLSNPAPPGSLFTHHDTGAELQQLHFDLVHFLRLADTFGAHSVLDLTIDVAMAGIDGAYTKRTPAISGAPMRSSRLPNAPADAAREPTRAGAHRPSCNETLTLRNMVPAPYLAPSFQACYAAVLFSATLAPWDFYRDVLGLPDDTAWQDADSPFQPHQLQVRIAHNISTRYNDRARSVAPITRLIAEQFINRPGNYLSYFSSFDYLDQVAAYFARAYPDIPFWLQARGMDEAARSAFLQRFAHDGQGIGFAVLGGAFSEGVDLPGSRLIGAFISTLGLPQFNAINSRRQQCMQALFGEGRAYDYTYLYPGLRKVVQAAGRVIRSTTDQGVVHLIDDRYGQPHIQALLPGWWAIR